MPIASACRFPSEEVRFCRRDTDGRLEFTGEDTIDHTPKDEKIRVFTGAAPFLYCVRAKAKIPPCPARTTYCVPPTI